MLPLFRVEDLQSSSYRWRNAGQGTMVHIFYQTFQLGLNAGNPDQWKRTKEDQYGRKQEIDAICLKRFFEDNQKHFPGGVRVVSQRLSTFDKTVEIMKEMDVKEREYERYDCFFFAFLTFSEVDGRLHFNDTTLEKGLVPLENVLEAVAELKVARGKPKIFLIQSDDMSLSREKVILKGDPSEPPAKKIPTEADRLIIQSTIPQKVVPNGKESFLIQAFVEVMKRNITVKNKDDMFSLTVDINMKVKENIGSAQPPPIRMYDFPSPLVTSTLTKMMDWHPDAKLHD